VIQGHKNICICGGGNEAHALAAMLSISGHSINIFTRNPLKWNKSIIVNDSVSDKSVKSGNIYASDKASEVIPGSDLVLISVPSFAYDDILYKISKYLSFNTIVGALPGTGGFNYFCEKHLNPEITYFSSQRVPFVARTQIYGHSVDISGYAHGAMKYAVSNEEESSLILSIMKNLLKMESKYLPHFLCIDLVNSNSLLHTTRLFSLGKQGETWNKIPLFYGEWDNNSSELFIETDKELFNLFKNIPEIDFSSITRVLDHYESNSPQELTRKIRSIKSLNQLKTPMLAMEGKYKLDFSSRYFTEDFPYGIALMAVISNNYEVNSEKINLIANWGLNAIGKDVEYVKNLFDFK